MLDDDLVCDAEAEAGALAFGLGGEERLEDARQRVGGHARTVVDHAHDSAITIDELSEKVKRAALLIRICKAKLTSTEEDVNQILKELEGKGGERE